MRQTSVLEKQKLHSQAYYDQFTKKDIAKLEFIFQQLYKETNGKKVRIFIIPTIRDLMELDKKGYGFELITRLSKFAETNPNIFVHDLMPYFAEYAQKNDKNYEELFGTCDAHWNKLGNKVAAEAVLKYATPL